ncbi:response regulator [Tellurirhabdus bombi]|uniref:response regulator n=1 Tax=Tellurirhabdus bombi TaxID=2907205 RepID=UPI001F272EA3|nr:response regulator [Tellurirhabdus bombi]
MLDILYIEDNEDDIDVFSRVIKKIDDKISCKIIDRGSEAVEYLTAKGKYASRLAPLPKVVLLDLNLPGYTGFDIIQQLRNEKRTKLLPIIVFSTSDNPKDINRSYELGVNAYIVKPGSYHTSNGLLRRVCDFWLSVNHAS